MKADMLYSSFTPTYPFPPFFPSLLLFWSYCYYLFCHPGDTHGCPRWQWIGGNSCRWWRWLLALPEQITVLHILWYFPLLFILSSSSCSLCLSYLPFPFIFFLFLFKSISYSITPSSPFFLLSSSSLSSFPDYPSPPFLFPVNPFFSPSLSFHLSFICSLLDQPKITQSRSPPS